MASIRTSPVSHADRHPLTHPAPALDRASVALAAVADAIGRMRYGAVQLTIHDGQVVQLEVTERQRFT
ncbi:YezD family protein [Novosphingobium aquimarinum]|uniref:YezD family protein n=1 Tax=Novosphingobium aquimarinum TaxID=2682494 RepID=UPI0012EB81DC|nr:YezD family protein [Novosphingobium aquimarinum]